MLLLGLLVAGLALALAQVSGASERSPESIGPTAALPESLVGRAPGRAETPALPEPVAPPEAPTPLGELPVLLLDAPAPQAATAVPPAGMPIPPNGASQTAAPAAPVPRRLEIQHDATLARDDPALERLVLEVLRDEPATFGVAIKELSTGRGLLVNSETEFYAASLFKLPLMYEVLHQWEQGALELDETLVLSARHVEFDLGTLDRGEGEAYSLGQALERMVTLSDNASAILLQDRVGAWRANQSMQQLGLRHTFVLADRLTTSPGDMLVFFEALARQTALDPTSSAAMVHLLLRQKVNNRLPLLLPRDTPVAHKTGDWPGNVHDAGIVYAPRATFVLAVLTDQVEHSGQTAETIARLAKAVYDYFGQLPTRPVPVPEDPHLAYPLLPPATVTPTAEANPSPAASPPAARVPAR
ncbi:MAG: serine hydrolase [Chloroflexi bacterium]|nr:serine hydrolase [Chloroflexota bacterium]